MKQKIVIAVGIRLFIIACVIPSFTSLFFVPFLSHARIDWDIWSSWLESGGDSRSFPYGVAMLLVYLPSLFISKVVNLFLFDTNRSFEISIGLQLLFIEALIWRYIYKTKAIRASMDVFLFSPLLIWVNFVLGLNDFLPSACLFLSAILMLKHKYRLAGVFIGIAIGMKFSLALVLPFLILFAWDNPRFKRNIWIATVFSFVTGLIFYTPGLYSPGFQKMVFNNEESMKSLEYFISFQSQKVLLLPLIYIILLYWLWKAGRISIDVLIAFFGVALLLVSVFSPASIGWMLWGLPLMFMNLAKERRSRIQLFIIQSMFLFQSISEGIKIQTIWGEINTPPAHSIVSDLVFTSGVVLVLLYSYSSLKATIKHGDRYKISKAPLTVSIAGDSGTGKDTLSHALVNMFTPDTATILCGDDYHKYERGDSAWERTTHLNPTANYLDLWEKDIRFAHQRQNFEQREYDHNSGKFSQLKPRDRRDFLISQGLHGLYSRLTEYSDIRIFLSMSDELRIKFKVARDSATRGHTHDSVLASIENRSSDYLEFIAPQVENSDIHFHIYESDTLILLQVAAVSNFAMDEFIKSLVHSSGISVLERDRFNRKVYEINPLGVSSTILTQILNNQLRDYDQLFLEAPNIPEGVLGIMATLSIVMLANKRDELYE